MDSRCNCCSKPLPETNRWNNCRKHIICTECCVFDHCCKSRCPQCWYDNSSTFLEQQRICSVCNKSLVAAPNPLRCSHNHQYCPTCIPEGCALCKFHHFYASSSAGSNKISSENIDLHKKLSVWEQKFEKNNHHSANERPEHHRQTSSDMDVDEYPIPTAVAEDSRCMICLEDIDASDVLLSVCHHRFHNNCLQQWYQSSGKQVCPTCGHVYATGKGPQPPGGKMDVQYISKPLPGFSIAKHTLYNPPTIEITYTIPSGNQGPLNPQPGRPYHGTSRTAYLPNNEEGQQILGLLKKAFYDQHLFTIGRSTTTGAENVVTWNDVHHKTSISGGPSNYGYPDPTYLNRVRQELAAKGYV